MATRRSGGGGGVRIPVGLDTEAAEQHSKELGRELKAHLTPVVDVVNLARQAYDALYKTIGMGVGVLREAVDSASEAEQIERRTIAALKLRGEYEEAAFERLKASNAARERQYNIEDDLQLQLQGTATALGVKARHLDLITNATIGLSESTGQDLNTALMAVVKTYEGNTTALKRMGIEVKSVDEGLDRLATMAGLAAERSKTFSGEVDRMKLSWGKLLEELGNAIIKNEDVKALLADVGKEIREITEKLAENGPEVRAFFSSMVEGVRDTAAFIRENRGELTFLLELAIAMKGMQVAGGLVGAAKQLGAGGLLSAGGSLLGRGAAAAGSLIGLGGSAILGAAVLGPFAQALALGNMAVPLEDARKGIAAGIPMTPGFRFPMPTEIGPTLAELGADPSDPRVMGADHLEFLEGADIKSSESERRASAAAAARERDERHKEAQKSLKATLSQSAKELTEAFDADEKREKEHQKAMASLRADELEARAAFNAGTVDLELERLVADREVKDAQYNQTKAFYDDLQQVGVTGLGQFFSRTTQVILSGKGGFEGAMKGLFGMMLSMAGQALMVFGAGALAAASASTVIPFLWPIFGGPIGVGGALGLIAAGGILTGAGSALSSSASSAAGVARGAAGRAPSAPAAPRARGERFEDTSGANATDGVRRGRGGAVNVINVMLEKGVVMGTDYELARWLADLLGRNGDLSIT